MAPVGRGILSADWTNLLVGGLIIVTPYLAMETRFIPFWNSIIVGGLVAALSAWNMWAARSNRTGTGVSTGTINLVAGLWLAISPFVMVTNMTYRWATLLEGVGLVLLSGYVAYAMSRVRGTKTRRVA